MRKFIIVSLFSIAIAISPKGSFGEVSPDRISQKLYLQIQKLDAIENDLKEIILKKRYKDGGALFIISSIKQMIRTTNAVLIGQMEMIANDKYIDSKFKKIYSEQRYNSINLKKVVLNANKVELKRLSGFISNRSVDRLTTKSVKIMTSSLELLDDANRLYEAEILNMLGSYQIVGKQNEFDVDEYLDKIFKEGEQEKAVSVEKLEKGVSVEEASKIFELKKFTDHNPKDVEAWIQLGNLYFDSENFEKAINAYQKSLALKPDNANVLTDMGVMYRRSGKPVEAIKAFDKAIAVDPRHEVSRFNKGIVLMHDLNDLAGAVRSWEELVTVNPAAKSPNGLLVSELIKRMQPPR